MNRVIIVMIAIIVIISAIMVGMNIYQKQEYASKNNETQVQSEVAKVSQDEEIYDECTEEWENINNTQETVQVNSNYKEQDKYVLREKDGKIVAYKINQEGEEVEYLSTDIAVDYLAEDDKQNLKKGITASNKEELNQLLEDFE